MRMETSLLESIRIKVGSFRINEAKDVLDCLKMPKSGRKDELIGRILTIFQDAANLTAQGHTLRDQSRVDLAAGVVDATFERLVKAQHPAAVQAAARLWQHGHHGRTDSSGQGSAGQAAAAATAAGGAAAGDAGMTMTAHQGPPKRLRLTTLMPQRSQFRPPSSTAAAAPAHVEEVITAFMNGEEGVGATNTRVRCVCSNHVAKEPILQCEGAFCGVWQHAACVRQQLLHSQVHLPGSDKWLQRRQFFCERCRVSRADPFWEVYDTLVMPPQLGRMTVERVLVPLQTGGQAEWAASRSGPCKVTLGSHQLRLLQQSPGEYQLQALALCLEDPVQFRSQWPTMPLLKMGDRQLRVVNRMGSVQAGPMQRDMPVNLTPLLPLAAVQEHGGVSFELLLDFADPQRTFVLLAYIMRRRTREQVKALMKPPESLAAAVQRVKHFMNPRGGASSSNNPAAAGGARSQAPQAVPAAAAGDAEVISDDDDIVVGNRVVSLKDPNSFSRIVQPARFTDTCNDLQAFDLDTFLDIAQSTLKWIDPHSMKASCVQSLQVDTYLSHILAGLSRQPGVLEVEINSEAEWRPAGSSGPFMSVLTPPAAAGAAGSGAGGAGGVTDSDDDEEEELAELRRAASEMKRGKQHEVIELLDSDDDDDTPAPPQQQQQPGGGGGGGGLRIQLPSRVQQQQQHLHQQQQQVAAANMTAAAAVGPPVPHMTPGIGVHMQAGAAGSVMSPRAISTAGPGTHAQPYQQQQQQVPPMHHQQQQQQQHPAGGPGPNPVHRFAPANPTQHQQQQQQQQPPAGGLGGNPFLAPGGVGGAVGGGGGGYAPVPVQYQILQSGQQAFLVAVTAGMQMSPQLGAQQYVATPASGMMQQGLGQAQQQQGLGQQPQQQQPPPGQGLTYLLQQ